jgi:hypothetical protein
MTKQERNVCARINCSYICHRKNNSKSFFISKKVIDFFKKNNLHKKALLEFYTSEAVTCNSKA